MATWLNNAEARSLWRDAPADDTALSLYLTAARQAVVAYAPPLESIPTDEGGYGSEPYGGEVIPDTWRLAQYMQARNIFNAGKASPSGSFDGSEYGLSSFPLDWQIMQILRPQRVLGAIR